MGPVRHVTGAALRCDARQMRLKDFVAAARAAVPCQELGRELGECKRETAPGRLFGFKSCTHPGHQHSSRRGTVHYAANGSAATLSQSKILIRTPYTRCDDLRGSKNIPSTRAELKTAFYAAHVFAPATESHTINISPPLLTQYLYIN